MFVAALAATRPCGSVGGRLDAGVVFGTEGEGNTVFDRRPDILRISDGHGVGVDLHDVRVGRVLGYGAQALPGAAYRQPLAAKLDGVAKHDVRHMVANARAILCVDGGVGHHHHLRRRQVARH